MFLGFLVCWMILILGCTLLELVSESEWFFVERAAVVSIEQGTWIIGDKAYLPDGRITKLDPKNGDISGATDITSEMGKGPHAAALRWHRVLLALFTVPVALGGLTFLYRRFIRIRLKGA